jgi:hypothetical protein
MREEVVQALVDAHQSTAPAFALVAVEFESAPTDEEKAAATEAVIGLREAEWRRAIAENERALKELRERFGSRGDRQR